jgi:N-acyl-D-amino-acid deacylase
MKIIPHTRKAATTQRATASGLAIFVVIACASMFWSRGADAVPDTPQYSIILRGGMIYDGSGRAPYIGDVGIKGDRVVAVARRLAGHAQREINISGKAVAPGFINMLAHPERSLLIDSRAQSDLRQGVTLEVMGEFSMGPLSPHMKELMTDRQGDIRFDVDWTTLGEYLNRLQERGISVNVASFVSAATVRENILGATDVQPTAEQLAQMRALVHQAMEEGALGVTTMLIYSPAGYAKTPELIELAKVSAKCGGIYSVHMRSEGDRISEAVRETIDIARESGAPAEIYHLKLAGRDNWDKMDQIIAMIEAARASGVRITADMYTYTAGATGLDPYFPPWVQSGGLEAWIEHLKDPAVREKVIAEMRNPHTTWENLGLKAGGDGMLLLAFKNPELKKYTGKTLAEVARLRGKSVEDTAIDLLIEDGSRVGVAYFLMSEDNIRREIKLPWVSFGSDADAPSNEGVFLKNSNHPRAFGNFSRLLGKYVRDEKVITLQEAVRRLTSLPAANLSLKDRGQLKPGYFADVIVFDPAAIQDHATYENPQQYSTGVEHVIVNGVIALENGEPTSARPGRALRGRAYTGTEGGGCRASSQAWSWKP